MKVKQISLDILFYDDDIDVEKFTDDMMNIFSNKECNNNNSKFKVIGSTFNEDLTELYKKNYKELLD